jgi:hypothetical protein
MLLRFCCNLPKYLYIAGLVLMLLLVMFCPLLIHAQKENTFYVKGFAGPSASTVGAMTSAAQNSCDPNTAIQCVIVFDPTLSAFPVGVMPPRCVQCYWEDYRVNLTLGTSGQGYFFGGTFFMSSRAPIAVTWNTVNEVRVWQMVIPIPVTVRKCSVRIATLSAGGKFGCGLYDKNGNRLWWGTVPTAAVGDVVSTVTGGDIDLVPDIYYFAWTNDNTVAAFQNYQDNAIPNAIANVTGTKAFGSAANPSVAGVLPATLGVITPTSLGFSPAMVVFAP